MAKTPNYDVRGRLCKLSEGRLVFLGTDVSGQSDALFVAFRNAMGDDTKLTMSPEAIDALIDLRRKQANHFVDDGELQDFPHKRVWKVVKDSRVSDE